MLLVLDRGRFFHIKGPTFTTTQALAHTYCTQSTQNSYDEPTKEQPHSNSRHNAVSQLEAVGDVVIAGVGVVLGAVLRGCDHGDVSPSPEAKQAWNDHGVVDGDREWKGTIRLCLVDNSEGVMS